MLVEDDIEYWSRAFGVPRDRLAMAIQDVGPKIADLRALLGTPRKL